jgi:hypothetical protein
MAVSPHMSSLPQTIRAALRHPHPVSEWMTSLRPAVYTRRNEIIIARRKEGWTALRVARSLRSQMDIRFTPVQHKDLARILLLTAFSMESLTEEMDMPDYEPFPLTQEYSQAFGEYIDSALDLDLLMVIAMKALADVHIYMVHSRELCDLLKGSFTRYVESASRLGLLKSPSL